MLSSNQIKNSLSFLCAFFCSQTLFAQQNAADTVTAVDTVKYWSTNSSVGLNFSQVQLSNWTGGGESSISVGSIVLLTADYARGNSVWENKLDVAYGLIRQGDEESARFRKTDDLLNIVSRYSYHLDEGFFISAILDYRTQMDVGYDYISQNGETTRILRSDFMAPGFLISSLGVTYKKPKVYSVTLSPFTGKFTFVLNDSLSKAGAFGLDPGERIRSEAGLGLAANYEQKIYTNINFRTRLNLFAGYIPLSRVDVNWEGTLLLKVNQFIKTTIQAQLVYDHDIIQKVQWRNVINVGLLVEF